MARLRKEEEARSYERMMSPAPTTGTILQPYAAVASSGFAAGTPIPQNDEDDEVTYAEVNRQVALIFNVLLSIVACSAALWMVASNWSVPRRLGLSMAGSIVVAVAEVVVYSGYLRRVQEAKAKAKKKVESKEIIDTWVISTKAPGTSQTTKPVPQKPGHEAPLRKRVAAT